MPPTHARILEIALAVSVAVAFADSSIVVLALPELFIELQTTIPEISWVVTAYNLAVVVAAFALLPFVRRVRPAWLLLAGLGVFLAAAIACALANSLEALVAGRVVQGIGAGLLLGASLPVLLVLSGDRRRAIAIWVTAGTLGTAVGPALGGILTELFDWRAIFAVQAPLAAAAIAAALSAAVRALPPPSEPGRMPLGSALALVFTYAALVGALFLAVLLIVTVWDYGPLAGAGIVSALPVAALCARPLSARLSGLADIVGGSALLAAGLAALALLPASDPAYAVPALALAGVGLGLALPPLTRASLAREGELARSATSSVGVPPPRARDRADRDRAAPRLGARRSGGDGHAQRDGGHPRRAAPADAEDPDHARPLPRVPAGAGRGDPRPGPAVRRERRRRRSRRRDRARRPARVGAGGADARVPLVVRPLGALRRAGGYRRLCLRPEGHGVSRRWQGLLALAALGLAAVVLIAVELANGALDYGESNVADPCVQREPYPGEGFEATIQRIVLDGLDGAACELNTTREELVLSVDPELGRDVEWDDEALERAVRAGLLESIAEAEARGSIGGLEARLMREVVERAPLDWLVQGGTSIADLLGGLFDRR